MAEPDTMDQSSNSQADEGPMMSEEIKAAEKVINAFFYYSRYGREKVLHSVGQLRKFSTAHQELLKDTQSQHIRSVMDCIEHNHKVLKQLVTYGIGMFGDDLTQAVRIHQSRRPDAEYMSKVVSTLRQIVREWSADGREDRDATFKPIVEELNKLFPDKDSRHEVKLLLPGSGLGRLPWDLILEGFSVTGNECSLFMLMVSCYLLNNCQKAEEFTVYPYIFDKSNSWSYEDQIRPVLFPDICTNDHVHASERKNQFSMNAGHFLDVVKNDDACWDGVVTSWFIDTASNIIEYSETIKRILKPGGVWVNVGPLTYHYEDVHDEPSIELPYSELMKIIRHHGFIIEKEDRVNSFYAVNCLSMLRSYYTCALFVARKPL